MIIPSLIPGRRFVVDGYDPETKTVYEFYGDEAHGNLLIFNSNVISAINKKKTYGELNKKTKEREEIFVNAGFKLITMWESYFNNIMQGM